MSTPESRPSTSVRRQTPDGQKVPRATADEFEERLRLRLGTTRGVRSPIDPRRAAYRRAAALFTCFDPTRLRLPGDSAIGGAVLQLVDDCIGWTGSPRTRWALKPEVRESALRSFGEPAQALQMLDANAELLDPDGTEQVVRAYLRGEPPALDDMRVEALNRTREAVEWLSRLPGGSSGLPPESEVSRRLERRRLLEPLESLLRDQFEGRTKELEQLRAHLGILPSDTWWGRAQDVGRSVAARFGGSRAGLPLVVFGPGGIGKSTLVARFLLDHVTADRPAFPFVYVDFERVTVSVHEPMTMLAEIARQLGVQYPAHAESFAALAREFSALSRKHRRQRDEIEELRESATTWAGIGRDATQTFHSTARDEDEAGSRALVSVLQRALGDRGDDTPLVIVLDSFEEAQYRASPVLHRLWHILRVVSDLHPNTRIVVAGRAPVEHPDIPVADIPVLELGELDRTASVHFLAARGVDGVTGRSLAERIGGNPLSLQLAADVYQEIRHGQAASDWVKTLPNKRRLLLRSVDDMVIQGVLYDRLLRHLQNPEIRLLAHPGLVLRRLTPHILRDVLGPVCGVDIPTLDRARELCREMARRLDLVDQIAPEVLTHRADVRRVMLRMIEKDQRARSRQIERAAITFYEGSDDPADRAEELYHRLRLGQDPGTIESRWLDEAGRYLIGSEREMPAGGGRLLRRMLERVPAGPAAVADQLDWEVRTAPVVEDLLTQGFLIEAVDLMTTRTGWSTCSPLHPLHADALLRLGRLEAARRAVTTALDQPGLDQCGDTYLQLLLLSARIAAVGGDVAGADADLQTAERVATGSNRDLDAVGAMLQRAQLHTARGGPASGAADAALAERISTIPEATLASRPTLFRAIAAEIGAHQPDLLARALDLVGLPDDSRQSLLTLAHGIADAAMQHPGIGKVLQQIDDGATELLTHPRASTIVHLLEKADRYGGLTSLAKDLLTVGDDSGALRSGIAKAMSGDSVSFGSALGNEIDYRSVGFGATRTAFGASNLSAPYHGSITSPGDAR